MPGCFDDLCEVVISGAPSQNVPGLRGAADQNGRVAGAAVRFDAFNGGTGGLFGHPDDLAYRKTVPVAEVEGVARSSDAQVFQGQDVGIGQVGDVDVVADASPVVGFVIGAENLHVVPLAGGDVEDQRDQVSLRVVALTHLGIGVRPGSVEIAKVDMPDPVGMFIVLEDLFDHELAPAIGVNGRLGVVFRNRDALWHAIGGAGGRKNDVGDVKFAHGIEKVQGVHDIVSVVLCRVCDRFSDVDECAEVHDGLDGVLPEAKPDLITVGEVAQNELTSLYK